MQVSLKQTYKKGYITDFETRRHTKQGKILDVSISGASYQNPQGKDVGIVVNLRDITEWKQTQEIMIQNEKMMSLGGLAAGMAHEIKNPLSAIIQNSQVLQNRLFDNLPVNIKTAGECNLSLDAMRDYLLRRKINSLLDSFLERRPAHFFKHPHFFESPFYLHDQLPEGKNRGTREYL